MKHVSLASNDQDKWASDATSKYYTCITWVSEAAHCQTSIKASIIDGWRQVGVTASSRGVYIHRQTELAQNGAPQDTKLME